jgi:hypothetical protein
MKKFFSFLVFAFLVFASTTVFAQSVKIGPRISGNYNIYNQQGLTLSFNGIGVGIGGTVDVSFSSHIGIMTNLTAFDMSNFSNSTTNQGQTEENSYSLYFLTLDPMFKAEFSGFYMVAGPSVGIKLGGSGEQTVTQTGGGNPKVNTLNTNYNSIRFGIAVGTGYNFNLSQGLYMATDIVAGIPLSKTFDAPGLSNSIFTLKLGVALKFSI